MKTMVMYGTIDTVVREVITMEFQLLNNKMLNLPIPSLIVNESLKNMSFSLVEVMGDKVKFEEPEQNTISYYDYKKFINNQAVIGNVTIKEITERLKELLYKQD